MIIFVSKYLIWSANNIMRVGQKTASFDNAKFAVYKNILSNRTIVTPTSNSYNQLF